MGWWGHALGLPLLLFCILPQLTQEMGLESGGTPLYTADDKIVLLNATNFQPNICGSERAWLVEFYSSWCGHCIHFAPTFKQLAADVNGWRDVMGIAAIDCAQEENMPTCREYEVMGYPTIKFFPPGTPAGNMGEERASRDKSVPAIKKDMVGFLKELQQKKEKSGRGWPNLLPAEVDQGSPVGLWDGGAILAIIMAEEVNATMGSEVLLDIWSTVIKLKVPLNIVRVEGKEGEDILSHHSVTKSPGIVAWRKDGSLVDNFPGQKPTREAWFAAIKDFIWARSSELSLSQQNIKGLDNGGGGPAVATPSKEEKLRTASKKEIIARRFKVFASDLEKAVHYSIAHEVAQHSSITGETLQALQDYVAVLEKYFPGRMEMMLFLREVRKWVGGHQDTVRGEDLQSWITGYQTKHGLKPASEWIGCKGSQARYGGYPCGLWSLWHSLTVSQAAAHTGDPREVLKAMQGFIEHFFGCRECARHFQQAIQDGQAIKEEVETHDDAVLFLWKVHNKANMRLQGDISEDPVFPKMVFPPREFCKECYGNSQGLNLWDEFDRARVLDFLRQLYSQNRLLQQGLSGSNTGLGHALVPLAREDEKLDTGNFRKEANSSSFVFFNGADISICLMLWVASALLLIGIYLRFVSGKRFHHASLISQLRRKTGMSTPLLPK